MARHRRDLHPEVSRPPSRSLPLLLRHGSRPGQTGIQNQGIRPRTPLPLTRSECLLHGQVPTVSSSSSHWRCPSTIALPMSVPGCLSQEACSLSQRPGLCLEPYVAVTSESTSPCSGGCCTRVSRGVSHPRCNVSILGPETVASHCSE